MLVKDLKPNQPVDQLELQITQKEEPRDFTSKYGKAGRVCNAVGTDQDGETVEITLWNGDIEKVAKGQKIRITNGWVKQWRGKVQVSPSHKGTLEIISS
jgi:ssDNA-binding replication factor A large subunit